MIIPFLDSISINDDNPEDINDFATGGVAIIGEEGISGWDCFSFGVITPKRLLKRVEEDEIVFGKSKFIVNGASMKSNIELIKNEINTFLPKCARETWEEVALAINCYLDWEFYDSRCGICEFYLKTNKLRKQSFYVKAE